MRLFLLLVAVEVVRERSLWLLIHEGILLAEVQRNLVWLLEGKPQIVPLSPLEQLAAGFLAQPQQSQRAPVVVLALLLLVCWVEL